MFAPVPAKTALRLKAKIYLSDFTEEIWTSPIIGELPEHQRYLMGRWKKWAGENASAPQFSHGWSDIARYVLRSKESKVRSTRVELIKLVYNVPAPKTGVSQPIEPPVWKEEVFHTYIPKDSEAP